MNQPIHTRPPYTCDCHAHVFAPARFPYAQQRAYTPPAADVEDLRALHERLSVDRVVLVQPSVYGTDNACMLDAIASLGAGRARGLAVVDLATVTDQALSALHAAGVRGARLNLDVTGGGLASAQQQVRSAVRLRAVPGWSLQVHARLDLVVALLADFRALDMPVVLDHYAGGLLPDRQSEDLLEKLLRDLHLGHLYVKLSAPYRMGSATGAAHAARLAREFAAAAPDRILWGTDWPHTGGSGTRGGSTGVTEPFRIVDNQQVLRDLLDWLPNDDARHRMLVRNPAALYGFDAQGTP